MRYQVAFYVLIGQTQPAASWKRFESRKGAFNIGADSRGVPGQWYVGYGQVAQPRQISVALERQRNPFVVPKLLIVLEHVLCQVSFREVRIGPLGGRFLFGGPGKGDTSWALRVRLHPRAAYTQDVISSCASKVTESSQEPQSIAR